MAPHRNLLLVAALATAILGPVEGGLVKKLSKPLLAAAVLQASEPPSRTVITPMVMSMPMLVSMGGAANPQATRDDMQIQSEFLPNKVR